MPNTRTNPIRVSTSDVHAPAANTAAVVTYAASTTGGAHIINGIGYSYSAAPTGGNLKVEDGSGNTVLSLDITEAGTRFIPFQNAVKGSVNTALIITLSAGGGSVVGKLSVLGHYVDNS